MELPQHDEVFALRWLAQRFVWDATLDALRARATAGETPSIDRIRLAPPVAHQGLATRAESRVDRVA